MRLTRAVGLLTGVAADAVFADPQRGHPVAAFGTAATALERAAYRDCRTAGALFTLACVGGVACGGAILERVARGSRGHSALVAAACWAVLGSASLRREAVAVHERLARGDLVGARERVGRIVGRDTGHLDAHGVARAAIESIAENTSDAVVAPLLWGAIGGVGGMLGYRAVNTLDAMVGYRSARYLRFGWAAARTDDLANLLPARVSVGLVAMASGRPADVIGGARRYGRRHPSPNAGWCEAAFAEALRVRLGGVNTYRGRTERRPPLGDGAPPEPADVLRAVQLQRRVTVLAALVAAGLAAAADRSRR